MGEATLGGFRSTDQPKRDFFVSRCNKRDGTDEMCTPKVQNCNTVPTDRSHKAGGGLITLIRDNSTFTTTDIPATINTHNFKWSRYSLTTLNTSQLQTYIYLLETRIAQTVARWT